MASVDRATLTASLLSLINDNSLGEVTPADVRSILTDISDSGFNQTDDDVGQAITGSDPEGTFYQRDSSGSLVPAAIAEQSDRIVSTKSLQAPPGSLLLGTGLRLSSGLNTLIFERAGGTQQSLVSMVPYTSGAGSSAPLFYSLASEISFPITTVFSSQLTSPQTITFVPATADSFVTKFRFRPATAGTLRIEGFSGATTGGDLIIDFNVTVSAGDIGNEVTMDTPSPVLSFIGDQFTIRASGVDLFGGLQTVPDYTGQTLPFVTLLGHVVTQVQYTSPNTISQHLADRATASDGAAAGAVRDLLGLLAGDQRLAATAIRGLPDIPDQARLHFVSATFINATRTLRFTRDSGSTLDVVIPESTSGFLQPRLTEFALPNTPERIGTADDLIGDLNIQFHISESANLNDLSLLANSVNVGAITTFTPDGVITATVNISSAEWTSITTADSTQVVFQLSGEDKDTPANTITSNTVTVRIADIAASEFLYYGTSTSNNPATLDVSTLNSLEAATGTFTLDAIDPAQDDWLIFLAPQDHDLTALVNTGINRDVLSLFTETTSVRTINGQLYDSYVLGPANDVPAIVYRATLA